MAPDVAPSATPLATPPAGLLSAATFGGLPLVMQGGRPTATVPITLPPSLAPLPTSPPLAGTMP